MHADMARMAVMVGPQTEERKTPGTHIPLFVTFLPFLDPSNANPGQILIVYFTTWAVLFEFEINFQVPF